MKIAIGCDAGSYPLKEAVKAHLLTLGYTVADVGENETQKGVMYYTAACNVGAEIQAGKAEKGIVICGTGAGVSMVSNKLTGIYCVACESIFTAEKISLINNANVLAMGARVVSETIACEMAEKFLAGIWCEGFAEERRKNNENGYALLQKIENGEYQ